LTLVVDASVALKWVLDEDGADRAKAVLSGDEALLAPDFLLLEAANVLATKVRRGLITAAGARNSLSGLREGLVRFAPSSTHLDRAHALAVELERSVYDSLYLALALAESAVLVTADGRFAQAVARSTYAGSAREL